MSVGDYCSANALQCLSQSRKGDEQPSITVLGQGTWTEVAQDSGKPIDEKFSTLALQRVALQSTLGCRKVDYCPNFLQLLDYNRGHDPPIP